MQFATGLRSDCSISDPGYETGPDVGLVPAALASTGDAFLVPDDRELFLGYRWLPGSVTVPFR
jgi:hypothetical protein